jgi:glutamate carboxypeptidase
MNSASQWIDSQREQMLQLVTRWAEINSGTHNHAGIARLANDVVKEFASLGGAITRHDLAPTQFINDAGDVVSAPSSPVIRIVKRMEAKTQVLLNIHLDTVYSQHHPFQHIARVDANTLRGPGVADAKGGLVVMLFALRAFEQTEAANNLGWEILLNADEEIGSPASAELLEDAAPRNNFALIYEPTLPDGALVGARKGSGNFTLVFRGKAAHVGRDFSNGRSAILAAAEFISQLDFLQSVHKDLIINCGTLHGGTAPNVVPGLAIAEVNVRITSAEDAAIFNQNLAQLVDQFNRRDGISVSAHGGFLSPPKPLDEKSKRLFNLVQSAGREIGLDLQIRDTGGTCDGNRLAAAGLPVVDTLGPRGGNIHSDQEYILIDSLPERAKLSALILSKLAAGQLT